MKATRRLVGELIAVFLIGANLTAHAQIQARATMQVVAEPVTEEIAQPDSVVRIVADAKELPRVPPDQLPLHGTFWVVIGGGSFVLPMPFISYDQANSPVYSLGSPGQFLVDATRGVAPQPTWKQAARGVTSAVLLERQGSAILDLVEQVHAADLKAQQTAELAALEAASGKMTADGSMSRMSLNGSGGGEEFGLLDAESNSTNLWLEVPTNALTTPNQFGVVLHNTIPGAAYDFLAKEALTDPAWNVEPPSLQATTNFIATQLLRNGRTNLFVRARFAGDSTGIGLPDWWSLQYFGTTDVDPYADPDGDGWNNSQEYQNGTSPVAFNTPPPPQGFSAIYNNISGKVNVRWQPSAGLVTGYSLVRYDRRTRQHQTNAFSVSATSYVDNNPITNVVPFQGIPTYTLQANYSSGSSAAKTVTMFDPNTTVAAQFVAGAQGQTEMLVMGWIPPGAMSLQLTRISLDFQTGNFTNTVFEIPVSSLTNNRAVLPPGWAASWPNFNNDDWYVQTVSDDGDESDPTRTVSQLYWQPSPPFIDGRRQLKDNLIFLLRAATITQPFTFNEFENGGLSLFPDPATVNCGYACFYDLYNLCCDYPSIASLNALKPFENNYLFRNFVFNPSDVDANSGWPITGADSPDYYVGYLLGYEQSLSLPSKYEFQTPTNAVSSIPSLLATNQTRWLFSTIYYSEMGLNFNGVDNFITNNTFNIFGLPYESMLAARGENGVLTTNIVYYDGSLFPEGGTLYFDIAQPQFQTVEYDFWQPDIDQLPGFTGFFTTNTTRPLFAAVGSRITIAGYAKLRILNGYADAFGYLGQYFDQAYTTTNGVATATSAGILSPYGEFLPTLPGPAALVTMPDIDTDQRGTGVVQVIKLQLDVNHDGVMDLSFAGPDNTSQANPMRFWVNNDRDLAIDVTDPGHDVEVSANAVYPHDYDYNQISSRRDLEDFSRLWICGVPALPASQGYSVTLTMAAQSGNPAIKLFRAAETNGGTLYLTDTNIASSQVYQSGLGFPPTGEVSPTANTLTLPANLFTNAGNKYFLFEGAGIGQGQLTLTIAQNGTNILAQTSMWLDLHDVKDFYERAIITNNTSGTVGNWTSAIQTVQQAPSSALGDDSDLMVLVHGINVGNADWLTQSDTVFKRLYWAGYHGKFATVKWPCNYLTPPKPVTPDVFNLSELQAYKASQALTNYLNQLRARFPDDRLHLLVHSQGNAVASEAIMRSGVPVDTYILTQGAISASAYDVNATNYAPFVAREVGLNITPEWQPMGYHGIYTNLTGRIVNFYNPNDGVLAIWQIDQIDDKPSGYYHYDGTNCLYTDFFYNTRLVSDPQEARAMISRSRTLSIGQSGPPSGHGVIQSAVDLNVQYGFNSDIAEHSAQWNRPVQTSLLYYRQVLIQTQPVP